MTSDWSEHNKIVRLEAERDALRESEKAALAWGEALRAALEASSSGPVAVTCTFSETAPTSRLISTRAV